MTNSGAFSSFALAATIGHFSLKRFHLKDPRVGIILSEVLNPSPDAEGNVARTVIDVAFPKGKKWVLTGVTVPVLSLVGLVGTAKALEGALYSGLRSRGKLVVLRASVLQQTDDDGVLGYHLTEEPREDAELAHLLAPLTPEAEALGEVLDA